MWGAAVALKDAMHAPREFLLMAAKDASTTGFESSLEEAATDYLLGDVGRALPRDFYPKQKPPASLGTPEAESALVDSLWGPSAAGESATPHFQPCCCDMVSSYCIICRVRRRRARGGRSRVKLWPARGIPHRLRTHGFSRQGGRNAAYHTAAGRRRRKCGGNFGLSNVAREEASSLHFFVFPFAHPDPLHAGNHVEGCFCRRGRSVAFHVRRAAK